MIRRINTIVTPDAFTSISSPSRRTHARRRNSSRRTGLSYALSDRIDLLNPLHWTVAAGSASPWSRADYFHMLEQEAPGNVDLRYGLIYEGPQPLAAITFQLVELSRQTGRTDELQADSTRRFSRALRQRTRPSLSPTPPRRALICGDLFVCRQPVHAAADGDAVLVWQGVAELIQRIIDQEKLTLTRDFVVVKDTAPEELAVFGPLRERGFQRIRVEPDFMLPLSSKWECYTDYVDQMKPIQRKGLNKLERDKEDAGLRSRVVRTAEDLSLLDHADFRPPSAHGIFPNTWNFGDFVAAAQRNCFHEHAAFRVHSVNGVPVAFTQVVREESVAYNHFWGLSGKPALPGCLAEAMLHGVVEDAIQLSCRSLSLGRTGAAEKLRLGAQPKLREAWVLHRNAEEPLDLAPLFRVVNHDTGVPANTTRVFMGE
ncbi:MAG: GNAT family N-acetyltransferase [Candidatus Hydrogenedentes bacterium]|nr:GNAT family N-acetyltransferase [Candidatus Hydrogenedentota bacterium]